MQADHHDDIRDLFGKDQPRRLSAKKFDQFIINNLDDLLGRFQLLPDLLALGFFLNRGNKVFRDFVVNVRLEQGQADLAQRRVNVILR